MKAAEYLIACKTKLDLKSDYKLAQALKIQTSLLARYLKGVSIPGPVVAFRVAEILGDQPSAVIAEFEAERAERDGKAEEAEELKGWARKLASILLIAGVSGFPNADAGLHQPTTSKNSVENLYIV
jgi:hypothetical protein